MKDVFISYDSFDHIRAENLMAGLDHHGFQCWKDDFQIYGGHPLPERMRQGIQDSKFLCAVVTPRYGKSYYARTEADMMRRREGILAPVRTIPCLFEGSMPAFFRDVAYVDFRIDFLLGMTKLVASLRHHTAENDQRESIAKLTAGGLAVLAAAAWLGKSDSSKQRERFSAVLFAIPHARLGALLKEDGYPVPSKKEDRVTSILKHFGVSVPLLNRLFTAQELRQICSAAGKTTAGTKAQLIESILSS